jgi:collagenase-like PrtC family protease
MVSERTILKSYTKSLDHLGIIAAIVAELGIVELVNARLPKLRHPTVASTCLQVGFRTNPWNVFSERTLLQPISPMM